MLGFPLEKILVMNYKSYLKSVGKSEEDYLFKGVFVDGVSSFEVSTTFSQEVPPNTEIVTDYFDYPYKDNLGYNCSSNARGLALIPKK